MPFLLLYYILTLWDINYEIDLYFEVSIISF